MQLANNLVLFLKDNTSTVIDVLYALYQDRKVMRNTQLYIAIESVNLEHSRHLEPFEKIVSTFNPQVETLSKVQVTFQQYCNQLLRNAEYIHLANTMDVENQPITKRVILQLVSKLTSNDANLLHVVQVADCPIVNYYFSYFLSKHARQQDCLFHIRTSSTDTRSNEHNISLLNIPLIKALNNADQSIQQQPYEANRPLAPIQNILLRIDMISKEVWINNAQIKLTPTLFSWYSWLALRRKYFAPGKAAIDLRGNHHEDFLNHFINLYGDDHHNYAKIEDALKRDDGFTINYMSEKRSRINKAIKQTLELNIETCLIQSKGKRPYTSYCLFIQPEDIILTQTAQ